MEKPPKPSPGDVIYKIGQSTVSAVPMVGPVVSNILSMVFVSPLEKLKSKWMDELTDVVNYLLSKESITIESLQENNVFIDAVATATSSALKTSDREKIKYLKNALINTGLNPNPDETKTQIYINAIDSLTVWHMKILLFADDPEGFFKSTGKEKGSYAMASLKIILFDAYPELASSAYLDIIWNDLERLGFQNASLGVSTGGPGLYTSKTTPLGKDFLNFIKNNP